MKDGQSGFRLAPKEPSCGMKTNFKKPVDFQTFSFVILHYFSIFRVLCLYPLHKSSNPSASSLLAAPCMVIGSFCRIKLRQVIWKILNYHYTFHPPHAAKWAENKNSKNEHLLDKVQECWA